MTSPSEYEYIECPKCKGKSFHPEDIKRGWCTGCNEFTHGEVKTKKAGDK